jgi:hypothetical protein
VAESAQRSASQSGVHDRGIVLALLVSVLLHTPLLLLPGDAWQTGALDEPLQVRILPQEVKAPDDDIRVLDDPEPLPPVDAPPAPEAPIEAPRLVDAQPSPDTQEPAPPAESEAPVVSELVALAGPAPDWLHTDAVVTNEPPSVSDIVATVAPSQESMLTRRLEREAQEFLDSDALERQVTFLDRGREFSAVLTRQPAADGTGVERITAQVITDRGGERVQTSLQMKRLAFSHFTHFVDRWDPWVQLHDDEIDGRFHSNTRINLSYDRKIAPRLLGKVTSAGGVRINAEPGSWRPRREIFVGGLAPRIPRIRLPGISLPGRAGETSEHADIHLVRADSEIVFRADGSYECVEFATLASEQRRLEPGRATYIIGEDDVALHVRGVVSGNVTVYSHELIVVRDDLRYVHDLRTGADDNGYLGLVSDGNIEIAAAQVTGPGDLEIHAAIYARERFVVRDVRTRGPSTLLVHGSLTVGSIAETEPRYATRIEFDPRFERVRPPGFPETDRYEVESWDGTWRLAEGPLPD